MYIYIFCTDTRFRSFFKRVGEARPLFLVRSAPKANILPTVRCRRLPMTDSVWSNPFTRGIYCSPSDVRFFRTRDALRSISCETRANSPNEPRMSITIVSRRTELHSVVADLFHVKQQSMVSLFRRIRERESTNHVGKTSRNVPERRTERTEVVKMRLEKVSLAPTSDVQRCRIETDGNFRNLLDVRLEPRRNMFV